ncbi:hypothetical protein HMPREF2826_01985 [Olsenella sp. HMSC062G07]|nr:hypothetical protein HMPREF2826_01985 [Olsenella sp. HMSC062G07]
MHMLGIAFDIDDTLYDLADPYRTALRDCFGPLPGVSASELFAANLRHFDETYERARAGELAMDDMFAHRQLSAFAEQGMSISLEEALSFQRVYRDLQCRISLTPLMRGLLDDLAHAGARLGVVSNGYSDNQWRKVRTLGLTQWFAPEVIVVSEDVGVAKPDRRIFDMAAGRMGTDPSTSWFVGDAARNDVDGAASAGWRTIWFDRGRGAGEPSRRAADLRVGSEEELARVVRGLLGRDCGPNAQARTAPGAIKEA